MTAVDRIYQKIKRSRRYVFERKDFDGFASYDQIGRALKQLVKKGELIKLGYGLYTKARINSLTGKPMPTNPGGSDALMREILKMKGVDFEMDNLSLQSLSGESTQIPSFVQYSWNPKQFNRKLVVGNRVLNSPS
ncbi:TPA: S-adenosylhomocysteine hydrolase [Vibrio parahaemolyticus]|nr:S-adenosylhomocysteine hydrolase [Vibrio parahaemolyticus]HBC3916016.1 S-adenosylhomocysteine hydrolase [Vibrio parahaemolyticus]